MKIKLLLSGTFFLMILNVFSQTNLNRYKYVVVPSKFDFLKEKNQYQLNDLAHFLFEKYGFDAVKEGDEYPVDLKMNRCLALRSDVLKESGMFKTKLKIELKDCNDQVVYTSQMGESREKEFKKAYNLALRDTFEYLKELGYNYQPEESIVSFAAQQAPIKPQVVAKAEESKEIQELKAQIENLKKEKEAAKIKEQKKEAVTVVIEPEQKIEAKVPVKKEIEKTIEPVKDMAASSILYAQPLANGFQLVDSSPKVVYRIKNTGLENVFLVEGKSAIIYKKGSNWVVEHYSGNSLKTETLDIKF